MYLLQLIIRKPIETLVTVTRAMAADIAILPTNINNN